MEKKKIKKLVIKSETIANLSDGEMNQQKGGVNTCDFVCVLTTISLTFSTAGGDGYRTELPCPSRLSACDCVTDYSCTCAK